MSQLRLTVGERSSDAPKQGSGHDYVAGEVIADKYRLTSRIAQGGMGSVWTAKNLALDAQVAIKLIRGDVRADAADERLLTEARTAARLKHPSVLRVFDFGRTSQGDPFIVMELLQGEPLGDLLDRDGRLDAATAVQLLLPVADGLAAAHAGGVIHRDIKPDNFFLSDSDGRLQPKIVDFGIARFHSSEAHRDRRLTEAGTVLGSPDYMSPEQARGDEDIDQRADVWAFCIVLYECITGRVPFEEANYHALLRHIIDDDVPSIRLFAAGDDALWGILQKGLAKERSERYQSMRELGEDLAGWLVSHGITEDACGHSLKVTWLDPSGSSPNLSRMSIPGSRLSSATLPTLPPPSPSGSVSSVLPPAVTPRWSRSAIVTMLVLVAVGFTATWLLTKPEETALVTEPKVETAPASPPHAVAPVVEVETTPTPTPSVGVYPTSTPSTATAPALRAPKPAAKVQPPLKKEEPAPSAAPVANPTPAPKKPNEEDLGF